MSWTISRWPWCWTASRDGSARRPCRRCAEPWRPPLFSPGLAVGHRRSRTPRRSLPWRRAPSPARRTGRRWLVTWPDRRARPGPPACAAPPLSPYTARELGIELDQPSRSTARPPGAAFRRRRSRRGLRMRLPGADRGAAAVRPRDLQRAPVAGRPGGAAPPRSSERSWPADGDQALRIDHAPHPGLDSWSISQTREGACASRRMRPPTGRRPSACRASAVRLLVPGA